MIRFRATWLFLLAVAAALSLLNGICWQPGIGGAVGGRAPGTQLEHFFGWPATYRAELWRSDDETLASRILAVAPFYDPGDEMLLEYRVIGITALTVDVAFGLLVLLGVAVIMEGMLRRAWPGWRVALLAVVGILLLVLWMARPLVSVSL
jgi:hypothetical protein